MKKLTIILLLFAFVYTPTGVFALEDAPISSAYIVIESSTGQVIAENNADERLGLASLTKIMLLLLIAEEINANRLCLTEEVKVSAHASSKTGSVIWLEPGEVMSVEDLVKSVVISSANDATVALAEFIGTTEEKFVALMNQKAYVLGMKNTNFTNAVGYDEPNHYSTARDVAIMSRALMREANYTIFADNMLTRLSSVRTGTERETQLVNTNNLITYYKGIEGIKTGTTDNAGFCLSASATRANMQLISVVMGCKDNFDRVDLSEKLLDFGFGGYVLHTPESQTAFPPLFVEGGITHELILEELTPPAIVLPRGRADSLKFEVYLPNEVTAPILKSQPIGTVTAKLDGEVVYESYIVAAHSVQKVTFWRILEGMVRCFFGV